MAGRHCARSRDQDREHFSTSVREQLPISLTATGEQLLRDSGLKSYIDHRRNELTAQLRARAPFDLYTVQQSSFRLEEAW
jgi:hypothetical protein